MKKLFSFILAAALLSPCVLLSGCNKRPAQSEPPKQEEPNDEPKQEEPNDEPKQEEPKMEYIEGREVISAENVNTFGDGFVNTYGRTRIVGGRLNLPNAGTAVEFSFYGTRLAARLVAQQSGQYYRVIVDGQEGERTPATGNKERNIAENLEEGVHTVRIVKCTPSQNEALTVRSVSTDGKFLRPEPKSALKIEFIGDSITAGSGTLGKPGDAGAFENSDATKGYSYLTAMALDADYSIVATDGICVKGKMTLAVNMLEMYTYYSSTDKTPYDFPYEQDVVVLSMGTNDTFYKSAHPEYSSDEFVEDYGELLTLVRSKNPNAYIVCTFGLMFENETTENDIKRAIAAKDDDKISFIHLPAGVNGASAHPSAEDAKLQSAPLVEHIKALLNK